ncbi:MULTISPECIES: asparaginase [unclassified Corynebacterium]|uniref:asparaginase n=1 Tax=unclassified Corynebacterium TaxID=2624378 RepID=UPI0029CA2162|nr:MULTISPECIES: asparaginase [unclassified Corynebacterium]WPF65596.1 asparaginase [Corynebacterium sp. 22KM0430]WPF68091.1 asparaginase [Corynebacterium sp. 21KM1197]
MRLLIRTMVALLATIGLLTACSASDRSAGTSTNPTTESSLRDLHGRVVVLTTGGTIASTADSSGALVPTLTGEQLLDTVRDRFGPNLDLQVRQVAQLDSSAMTFRDTDTILSAIREAMGDPEITGVVVTHGTDSMEETAVAADTFRPDSRPIVLTGAMKPADDPHPDGPDNLAQAIAMAADTNTPEGAFIAFGGSTFPARGTYKAHTTEVDGFANNAPEESPHPAPLRLSPLESTSVEIITAYPGAPRALIDAALARNARGLVIEGMGAGNVGGEMATAIEKALDQGVPVVMSTRVPTGSVEAAYGGAGGGATLRERGVISSGYFRAAQARVLLAAALATGTDPAALFAPRA